MITSQSCNVLSLILVKSLFLFHESYQVLRSGLRQVSSTDWHTSTANNFRSSILPAPIETLSSQNSLNERFGLISKVLSQLIHPFLQKPIGAAMTDNCFRRRSVINVQLLGAQIVEWLSANATYAADPGANPCQRTFDCMSHPPLSPISCLSTVK